MSVEETIEELAKLLLKKSEISSLLLNKCNKLVRYSNNNNLFLNFKPIKIKLKEKIKLNYSNSKLSISILIDFDKICESFQKYNNKLFTLVLILLENLSFYSNISIQKDIKSTIESINKDSITVSLSNTSNDPIFNEVVTKESIEEIHWISYDIEIKLLQDLLFIFQGINGKSIKYDQRSESYVIDPLLNPMSSSVKDIIYMLCEVGWLYNKIMLYTKRVDNTDSMGLLAQAFSFAIQEELHDYYRLLAVLEQELNRPLDVNYSNDNSTSGLTLIRLHMWMSEPLDRLVILLRLIDSINNLSGGALASRIHGFGRHGDTTVVSKYIDRLMDHICVPLYNMIAKWILYGDLQDPYEEFFIGINRNNSNNNVNIWLDTYFLRLPMLPSFLSLHLANRILVIGKTINYIRICINSLPKKSTKIEKITIIPTSESSMINRINYKKKYLPSNQPNSLTTVNVNNDIKGLIVTNDDDMNDDNDLSNWLIIKLGSINLLDTLHKLRYNGEMDLSDVIQNIAKLTDSKLLHMLENRFHMRTHLLALKKFLLLGQGDFVTCLMDSVGPELRKRSNQLFRHNLTGMLEGALRSSNAQYEPSYVLDRIGVRLLEQSPGDSGWEVFSLDYKIDTPLNAIVHSDAIAKYRTAFHMFWRLKRVEWSLSASWKQMMTFVHTRGDKQLPRLKPVIHRCTLSRGRMLHVINNLCAFIMFEVLETAWLTFQEKLSKASCLDDVISSHDSYLEEILDRALLTSKHENLNLQIQQLLQSILRFCTLEESLIADAMAAIARKRSTVSSKRSLLDSSTLDPIGSIDGVSGFVVNRLDDSANEFNKQFDIIMNILKDQGDQANDLLRYLTFRLDFNEYHCNQRALVL